MNTVVLYPNLHVQLITLLMASNSFVRSIEVGDSFDPGCYGDVWGKPYTHSTLTDHALCRLWCGAQKGLHVAGLNRQKNCSCYLRDRWRFAGYFAVGWEKYSCNAPCPGRPNQNCGGYNNESILMDAIYPELPDCFSGFREPVNNTVVGRDAYLNDKSNTRAKCRKVCSEMKYPFAAVWGMFNCWCTETFFGAKLERWKCILPCPGNLNEQCGGLTFAWIMKSDPVVDVTCLKDQRGLNYKGRVSVSARESRPCKQWSSITDDLEVLKVYREFRELYNSYLALSPEDKKSTYCRNLDNDDKGPWCFANYKAYCYIPLCPSEVTNPTIAEPCTRKLFGLDYIGSRAITLKGELCKSWSHPDVIKRLHNTQRGEWAFNQMPLHVQRSNLCRNADLSPHGPWCYIDSKFPKWGYCGISECPNVKHLGCKVDAKGLRYNGSVSIAHTGQKCRVWSDPEVQRHMTKYYYKLYFPYWEWDRSVQISNICRNPDGEEGGPWCYIEDESVPSWRFCDIKICDDVQPNEIDETEEFGAIGHGEHFRPNTSVLFYSLVGIFTYWKLWHARKAVLDP